MDGSKKFIQKGYDVMELTIILPLVALLITFAWGLLIGLRRVRFRFLCVAASFVISLFATLMIKNFNPSMAINILGASNNDALSRILQEEGLSGALLQCGGAVAAPWLFLLVFTVLCVISGIICGILFFVLGFGRKRNFDDGFDYHDSGYVDLVGGYGMYGEIDVHGEMDDDEDTSARRRSGFIRVAIYAAAQVLLTFFVILTPVVSTLNLIPNVIDSVDKIGLVNGEEGKADLLNKTDELNQTLLVKSYRAMGGDAICDMMATFKVADQKYTLHDEIGVLVDFGLNVSKLKGKQIQDYTEAEIEVLRAIDDDMRQSVFLPTVSGDLIYLVTDSWLDESGTSSALVLAKPSFDKDTTSMFADPFYHLVEAFHKDAHNVEALRADFTTLEHTMEILIRSGVIASMNEDQTNSLVELLCKGDTIDQLLVEFDKNPSFAPLTGDITKIGMRAMGSTLKIPAGATENENYEQFTGDLASKLNDMNSQGLTAEEQKAQLTVTIRETYSEQMGENLELSDEVVGLYADVLVKEFEGKEEITSEDMQKFFDSYSGVQSDEVA